MSRGGKVEETIDKAELLEKKYDWLEAVELYKQALDMAGKDDFSKKGEIQEKIGHCFYRAAFQAESQEEFKERMRQAVGAYEKAHGFYEELTDDQKAAWVFRCDAVAKFLGYWLTCEPSEKRRLLDECLELENKALTAFWDFGNRLEYGKTYNELPNVFWLRCFLEWDRQAVNRIVTRGVQSGERAIAALSKLGESYEIAKAQSALAPCLTIFGVRFVEDPEKKEQYRLEVIQQLQKAAELFEKVGDAYSVGNAHIWLGLSTAGQESMKHLAKAIECGNKTGDNFLRGSGMDWLAWSTYWKAIATENPDQRKKLAEEAMEFYDKAQHHYSIIAYQTPRSGVIAIPGGYAEHYYHLAIWETDPAKKLNFLQNSEKAGNEALKIAEDSDLPSIVRTIHHILSKTLVARARVEHDIDEKRSLLKKALRNRKRSLESLERLSPYDYWDLGVMCNYLAEIKAELGYLELDQEAKRRLLEDAISDKEKCLRLIGKQMPYAEKMGDVSLFAALYGYQDSYGILLSRLYTVTNNSEHLRKMMEISEKAIESANKLDLVSLIAESYWKIAKAQDFLEEHLKAAEKFKRASEFYLIAAERILQLKDFYQDHASYMQAWSEIERAKHNHTEKQYGMAKEHYEKAAKLHKKTKRWNYLAPNYSALALVEEAENLSRREQTEEAKDLFQQTTKLFQEAKESIKINLKKIETKEEKEMATQLDKASDIRREYCLGRIILEEAKILDRRGDHMASSRKYGSASEKFQEVIDAMETNADRRELRPIFYLCRAWEMMTLAEAEASPDLYLEASSLFDEAKEHSFSEKEKMLALGHSRFCKALEAGTRFEDTRDPTFHSEAIRHLESSANHYVKAGFKTASEYAKATQHLFDAYMYTHKAETDSDPKKKTQYYQMAEKLFQASAGSYLKAKHPEKSDQVQRLLDSIREKRQLAMSLTEVLHAPTSTSTTTSFSTPTPTREQAVGLERFERADIQANLVFRAREAKVGDDIEFRIEMINAGKTPALLVKVDETVPEGFELKEVPEIYTIEDSYINMKGKRLNPLKTEDVKVVVTPQSKGTFVMKPRILYLDETGKYKSHEPESVTITVKELGISGWIKGER